MEALLEILIVTVFHIVTIIFDPFIISARLLKRFWDSVNPDNLPEVLTFDEDESIPTFVPVKDCDSE